MVEVKRVSDGVMAVASVSKENVLRLICGHVPRSRSLEDKQSFYDEMKNKTCIDVHISLEICMLLFKYIMHHTYIIPQTPTDCIENSAMI